MLPAFALVWLVAAQGRPPAADRWARRRARDRGRRPAAGGSPSSSSSRRDHAVHRRQHRRARCSTSSSATTGSAGSSAGGGCGAAVGGAGRRRLPGAPGLLRLFNAGFGGQIGWLHPARRGRPGQRPLIRRRAPRTDVGAPATSCGAPGWLVHARLQLHVGHHPHLLRRRAGAGHRRPRRCRRRRAVAPARPIGWAGAVLGAVSSGRRSGPGCCSSARPTSRRASGSRRRGRGDRGYPWWSSGRAHGPRPGHRRGRRDGRPGRGAGGLRHRHDGDGVQRRYGRGGSGRGRFGRRTGDRRRRTRGGWPGPRRRQPPRRRATDRRVPRRYGARGRPRPGW